jgi:uncharacterized membrane protein YgaE (UPF0421/DUF939 family)
MTFSFGTTDDKGRSVEMITYVEGKNKDTAIKRYQKITGKTWPLTGYYAVREIREEESKKIKQDLKKKLKQAKAFFQIFEYYTSDNDDLGQTEREDKDFMYLQNLALKSKKQYSNEVKKLKEELKLLKME